MKLRVAASGIELSADLREYARRRANFSLGRFAARIRSLSIRLSDVNGPRGGMDKLCDVRVDVGLRNQVIVRERQADIHAAIAFAVDRVERAVQRQLKLNSAGIRGSALPAPESGD